MLAAIRAFWSDAPPEPRTRLANNPTLLFSWWCTCFSAVIILTRACGRKIRSDVLFREDWIMMAAMLPLFIRMGCVHVVLIYGTNNIQTEGHTFTAAQLRHREIGARLVLAARIFYAAYIWMSKLTVSEFLKRITIRIWRRSYELTLQGIRIFLLVTFIIVVITTLTECPTFHHYWQVIPDPGAHCRQGFAQLISMGTCDIITDILLIAFPIPIVLRSGQTWKRKLQLASLFSLSVIMIGVTATRVPEVIRSAGRQQYRTVWASCEILASTMVSNGVILGSFVRGKGTKKNRYRSRSLSETGEQSSVRRPTLATLHNGDSDEDLFLSLGCRIPEHLRDEPDLSPRPAPPAPPARRDFDPGKYRMPDFSRLETREVESGSSGSDDSRRGPMALSHLPSTPSTTRRVSFFDVGGLLGDGTARSPHSTTTTTTMTDAGGLVGSMAQDFAPHNNVRPGLDDPSNPPGLTLQSPLSHFHVPTFGRRRASEPEQAPSDATPSRLGPPVGVLGPMLERHEMQLSLQDAGDLLGVNHGMPLPPPSPPATTHLSSPRTAFPAPSLPLEINEDQRSSSLRTNGAPINQHPHPPSHAATSDSDPPLHDLGGLLHPGS